MQWLKLKLKELVQLQVFIKNKEKDKKKLKHILIPLLLSILYCFKLDSQHLIIQNDKDKVDLTSHLIYIGQTDDLNFDDIISKVNDQNYDSNVYTENKKLETQAWHWSLLNIENKLQEQVYNSEWILEFNQLVTEIEVVIQYDDGRQETHTTGLFVHDSKKTTHHTYRSSIVKFSLQKGEKCDVIIGLKSSRNSIPVNPMVTLESYYNYSKRLIKIKRSNAIFVGFMLLMILYNLFLFILNKDKAYFSYSIYLFAICLFAFYKTGSMADDIMTYIFTESPKYNYIGKFSTYLTIASYLYFLRYFLDLKKILPKWDYNFKAVGYSSILFLILDYCLMLYSNFSPAISDFATISYALIFVCVSFAFCYKLYNSKAQKSHFILAGLIAMTMGTFVTAIQRMVTIEFNLFAFKLGAVIEVIFFSIGLAYRQREREKEKQLSQMELEKSIFLQEQEQKETERLKELDKLKSKFFSNITHEFRTPLSVIMGMSDNIKDDKTKVLIKRNSSSLLTLINQILDLSKIENTDVQVNYEKGNVVHFIKYLTESFRSGVNTKNINLTFSSEKESLTTYFDEQKIQQIIFNIISNAIKFTPEKGLIYVEIKTTEAYYTIRISDNGIGIDESKVAYVFDRYYQIDSTPQILEQGTGIGLALTKELVELMKGEIRLESKKGIGTSVFVSLPIIKSLDISDDDLSHEMFDLEVVQNDEESDKKVILIVEDNQDVAYYIKTCLEETYKCKLAEDGVKGIEKATKLIPDLVISDIMMRNKNGYELVDELKSNSLTSHIPIILLTAKSTFDDKISGYEHGADAYMIKPFDKRELLLRVKNLISLTQNLQQKYNSLEAIERVKKSKTPNIEDKVLILLQKHISDNFHDQEFDITKLGQLMQMSKSQLFRKVKALTGLTPAKFLRMIRLKEAQKLLREGQLSIKEISFKVGFNDPNYFSRIFKEEFGYPPSGIIS